MTSSEACVTKDEIQSQNLDSESRFLALFEITKTSCDGK